MGIIKIITVITTVKRVGDANKRPFFPVTVIDTESEKEKNRLQTEPTVDGENDEKK